MKPITFISGWNYQPKLNTLTFELIGTSKIGHYGNMGCGVSKWGIQN